MKVILYNDVEKLGFAGDVRDVSGGFARNFLIPRKLAMPATDSNLRRWESEKQGRTIRLTKDLEQAKEIGRKIESISLTLPARSGREGHLFGSVTSQMVADALAGQGFSIEKKNIILESPIKQLGEYTVQVHLHAQVTAPLKVSVVSSSPEESGAGSPAASTPIS